MIRDLGDGLVLRRATAADAEPMAAFVGSVLRAQDGDGPSLAMAAWERDLMEGRHPSFRPADAAVVVDGTGAIVSCLHLVRRSLVSVPRDAALWRYELTGKRAGSAARREIRVLERDGEPVGYLLHLIDLWAGALSVVGFEVKPGVSWREAWIPALDHLFVAGDGLASEAGRCIALNFWLLGDEHPLYRVYRFLERDDGYAWYARVPDVAGFLSAVIPALERRLAGSVCAGHTGVLTLGFYQDGVRLTLERGKVADVEPWRPDLTVRGLEFGRPSSDPRRPLAMFPDRTFLQLLFGFRSLAELEFSFPDCVVRTHEARALLDALFPKTPSDVWAVV